MNSFILDYIVTENGSIAFEEFAKWWRRDDVTYTIKRSDPILPLQRVTVGASVQGSVTGSTRLSASGRPPSATGRSTSRSRGGLSAIPEDRSVHSAGGRSASASRTRPAAAAPAKSRQVPLPYVSYRGTKPTCEVGGLEPNRLYQFKLRYSGSRSSSILGPSLSLMTAPLRPRYAPMLINLTPMFAKVKWFPPSNGAYKFLVQLRSLAAGQVTKKTGTASQANVEMTADGWTNVFTGMETFWTSSPLVFDCSYELRVFGINYQGVLGEPSPVLPFQSLPRDAVADLPTPRNADATFTIECTGDICVGDTILITERLFAKAGKEQPIGGLGGGGGSTAAGARGTLGGGSKILAGGTLGATGTGRGVSGGGGSVAGSQQGDAGAPGAYLGERTIAAVVVRDNFRTAREVLASAARPLMSSNVTKADTAKIGKVRVLWLEVVWQRASTEACRPYELKPGVVVQRLQVCVCVCACARVCEWVCNCVCVCACVTE